MRQRDETQEASQAGRSRLPRRRRGAVKDPYETRCIYCRALDLRCPTGCDTFCDVAVADAHNMLYEAVARRIIACLKRYALHGQAVWRDGSTAAGSGSTSSFATRTSSPGRSRSVDDPHRPPPQAPPRPPKLPGWHPCIV
jgi:hypothetical protein